MAVQFQAARFGCASHNAVPMRKNTESPKFGCGTGVGEAGVIAGCACGAIACGGCAKLVGFNPFKFITNPIGKLGTLIKDGFNSTINWFKDGKYQFWKNMGSQKVAPDKPPATPNPQQPAKS